MDLGALELQIFVSLVVVLGSAFVALICDYLKGNNEQLRERNIELRVRTEERERFAILNPSAWLSQFRGSPAAVAKAAEAPAAPVAAESVMQSHATAEGLAQVAEREANLVSRVEAGDDAVADVPSVAGFDVPERRRSRRKRGGASDAAAKPGENSYDWVRPEVMARVARRAGGGQRQAEEEVAEVAAAVEPAVPLLAAPLEPIAPMAASIPESPLAVEYVPLERHAEVEQVAQSQARPTSTPPVIMLRPLPAMKLADELQRIAEAAQSTQPSYTSQLLEDVIAASAAKPLTSAVPEETLVAQSPEDAVAESEGSPAFVEQPVEPEAAALVDAPPAVVEHSAEEPGTAGVVGAPPVVVEHSVEEPETAYAFASIEEAAELVGGPLVVVEHSVEEPETAYAFASIEEAAELVGGPPVVVEHSVEEPETAYAFASIEEAAEVVGAPRVVVEHSVEEPETAYAFASIEEAAELVGGPPVAVEHSVEEPETAYAFASIEEAAELVEAPPVVVEHSVEEPETAYAFASVENTAVVEQTIEEPEYAYSFGLVEDAVEQVEAPPVVVEHPVEAYAFASVENTAGLVEAPSVFVEQPVDEYAFASIEHAAAFAEAPPLIAEQPTEVPATAYPFEIPEYAGSAMAEALLVPEATAPEPPPFIEELPFPSLAAVASFEPPTVEGPSPVFAAAFPTYDSLPPVVETPAYDWSGAEFAPLPETVFASEAFAAETYSELPVLDPVGTHELTSLPVPPAEYETIPQPISQNLSELLLPTGMQDVATYRRLLEMPNPMSGIVITISITEFNRLSAAVGEKDLPSLLDSVEVLMSSMVREGDFGVKLAADQWVFVYRIDDNGFSQRRVAGLSEKLWDFQLRHLGLSNISFNWAAVNVHAERLSDAVTAAVERMDASRRGTKKTGAERARLVVNG